MGGILDGVLGKRPEPPEREQEIVHKTKKKYCIVERDQPDETETIWCSSRPNKIAQFPACSLDIDIKGLTTEEMREIAAGVRGILREKGFEIRE